MKLVRCNGFMLSVWDVVDEPLMQLVAGEAPIKAHGWHLLSEDDARELLRRVLREGALNQKQVSSMRSKIRQQVMKRGDR